MQTTLNEIKKYNPCSLSWAKGLRYLNKTKADNEPIDFMTIHKVVGIEDAIWCLRTQGYKDYCLFLADVAEYVLPIFEAEYPHIIAPRRATEGTRAWYNGHINTKQLNILSNAAFDAAYDDTYGYGYDAYAAAGYAAAGNVYVEVANATIRAAVNTCSGWGTIEELFIKHFGDRQ